LKYVSEEDVRGEIEKDVLAAASVNE